MPYRCWLLNEAKDKDEVVQKFGLECHSALEQDWHAAFKYKCGILSLGRIGSTALSSVCLIQTWSVSGPVCPHTIDVSVKREVRLTVLVVGEIFYMRLKAASRLHFLSVDTVSMVAVKLYFCVGSTNGHLSLRMNS